MPRRSHLFLSALGLSSLFALPAYRRFRRETERRTRALLAGGETVTTPRGRIQYATWGEGAPILFCHGIMGGYDQGLVVTERLGSGFRWIAMSRFGYLGSPLPADPSPAAQADSYAALLDALHIERAPIVGASAGGPSALMFAIRHPDRCAGLVLASTVTHAFVNTSPATLVLGQMVLRAEFLFWLVMTYLPTVLIRYTGITPDIQARLTAEDHAWLERILKTMLPISPRLEGIVNDLAQISAFRTPPLDKIRVPTLVTHAHDDPMVPYRCAEYAMAHIRHAELAEMQQGGHFGMGNPETMARVRAFLRAVTAGPYG